MSDVAETRGDLNDLGLRLARVADLVDAIRACHPDDAEHVMSAILEEWRAGVPLPQFDEAESDAEFWAKAASFDYLRAVFIAAGRELVRYPLGIMGRQRMIERMLSGMTDEERRATLSKMTHKDNATDAREV